VALSMRATTCGKYWILASLIAVFDAEGAVAQVTPPQTVTIINPDFEAGGSQESRNFGHASLMADLDNVNGQELIVGAPGDFQKLQDNPRGFFFIFPNGSSSAVRLAAPPGFDVLNNLLGFSFAVGDVNADTHQDLVVGCPGIERSGFTQAGGAAIYFGPWNFFTVPVVTSSCVVGFPASITPFVISRLGWQVATGDLDSDGDAELVVTAPYHNFQTGGGFREFGFAHLLGYGGADPCNPDAAIILRAATNDSGDQHHLGRGLAIGNFYGLNLLDVSLGCSQWSDESGIPFGMPSIELTGKVQTQVDQVFDKNLSQHLDQPGTNLEFQKFGRRLARGDVDVNPFHDLSVAGVNFENPGFSGPSPASVVVVYPGPVNSAVYAEVSYGPGFSNGYGYGLTWCDTTGDGKDEIVIGDFMRNSGRGTAEVYSFSVGPPPSLQLKQTLMDPAPADLSSFAYSIARGRRGGQTAKEDLVIGAPDFTINLLKAGKIVLFIY